MEFGGVFFPTNAGSRWDDSVEEFNCMCSLCCSQWAHPHILEVNAFTCIHVAENGPNGEQALKLCVMQTGGTGPERPDKHITRCFGLLHLNCGAEISEGCQVKAVSIN